MRKSSIEKILVFVVFLLGGFSSFLSAQNGELLILKNWMKYSNIENVLYNSLSEKAFSDLEKRVEEVGRLTTAEQWRLRQEKIRKLLQEAVGEFPEKTPLNAKIVGKVSKKDFTIEKIIFESRPKFYVTAAMFIPKGLKGKAPAIIYCSGHSDIAFRNSIYQGILLNLVKKGFIVFAFDPIGQGERLQYYDADKRASDVGGPTLEHSYCGAQCFLSGTTLANYMIWDGIRVVDYLLTRKEVDKNRIGITGRSGGGTQSAYIAAFDDRIKAAAPECYITSFKRLLESMGPQDAEQNFYHGLKKGLDHADLLEVRAPKPAMMITTTRDMFSIQGARETAEEVRKVYNAFGKEENFYQIEDDAPHASTLKNREGMYAFFQKYLNLPGKSKEEKVELLSADELRITSSGQVLSSLGGATVFDLQLSDAKNILKNLNQRRRSEIERKGFAEQVKRVLGLEKIADKGNVVFAGQFQREGYRVEKYFIENKDSYPIPFLLMRPDREGPLPLLLYLHPKGMIFEAGKGQEMEWFVKKGYMVAAPDLPGYGELGKNTFRGDAFNFKQGKADLNTWFLSVQTGQSIVGIQLQYLNQVIDYLKSRNDVKKEEISAAAKDGLSIVLAYDAVIRDDFQKIALINPLESYESIVKSRYYLPPYIPQGIAWMLNEFDLPDLYANLAPRKLLIIGMADQNGKIIDNDNDNLEYIKRSYRQFDAENRIKIKLSSKNETNEDLFGQWLESD